MASKEIDGNTLYEIAEGFYVSEFTYKDMESTLVVIWDKVKAYVEFNSDSPSLMPFLVFQTACSKEHLGFGFELRLGEELI